MTRTRRIALLCVLVAGGVFVLTEYLYYFPLTPLSLDLTGTTRLPPRRGRARLLLVGDVLLGDAAASTISRRGYDHVFASSRTLLAQADLAVGNLEGPITVHARADRHKRWSYRMLPAAADALARAGFDAMSLANNHIRDCGDDGVRETVTQLRRAAVVPFGAGAAVEQAHRPALMRARGLTVALLGYVPPRMLLQGQPVSLQHLAAAPGRPGTAWGSADNMARDIRRVRQRADVVIVALHLGDRYQREPADFEQELSRGAIDAGADAVVAHGTHIYGPVERYQGRPILYGLGNFAFGSGNVFARFSLAAFLEVDLRTRRIAEVRLLPLYTVNYNPWVGFQTKVLRGVQARRVLRQLVGQSAPYGARLSVREDPVHASLELPSVSSF